MLNKDQAITETLTILDKLDSLVLITQDSAERATVEMRTSSMPRF